MAPQITVYWSSTLHSCHAAKEFLSSHGVNFVAQIARLQIAACFATQPQPVFGGRSSLWAGCSEPPGRPRFLRPGSGRIVPAADATA
jgi:hypothetical protein